ncbi:MAG: NAD(P)/FAD-dependent oxidoreductase [Chitinophagales bacterium]
MAQLRLKEKYDAVIIGSGIGGLTAGAILSRAGLKVAVFEKSDTHGGYLMGFTRHRFTFDTAIHWLNQCTEGGIVYNVFESIGTDYPKVVSQKRIKRYIGDDFDYLLTSNPDELKVTLQQKFPDDAKGIERFFRDARELGERMHKFGNQMRSMETMNVFEKLKGGLHSFRFVLPFLKHIRFAGKEGLRKGLLRYFKSPGLLVLFASEKELLSCLIPIGWAYYGDFQNPPTGGSQSFAAWLVHVIESFGNDVFYYSEVEKIAVKNQTAQGIIVNHRGHRYEVPAEIVVAACDQELLYHKLLPEESVTSSILKKLEKAELYDSSFTIHVALKKPASELGFNEEMFFITRQDVSYEDQTGGDPHKSELLILSPSHRDPAMAPEGKGAITIFMPALLEHHDFWKATKNHNGEWIRGEAYNQNKEEIAQILLKRIAAKVSPQLLENIEFYEIATPITHLRYSGNKNGSMMGTRPGKVNYQLGVAGYKTPVKNLLIGGQWAELGGGVPIAAKAGLNAALLVLKQKRPKAFSRYIDYINGKISAARLRNDPAFLSYTENWERKKTPSELLAIRRAGDK